MYYTHCVKTVLEPPINESIGTANSDTNVEENAMGVNKKEWISLSGEELLYVKMPRASKFIAVTIIIHGLSPSFLCREASSVPCFQTLSGSVDLPEYMRCLYNSHTPQEQHAIY